MRRRKQVKDASGKVVEVVFDMGTEEAPLEQVTEGNMNEGVNQAGEGGEGEQEYYEDEEYEYYEEDLCDPCKLPCQRPRDPPCAHPCPLPCHIGIFHFAHFFSSFIFLPLLSP